MSRPRSSTARTWIRVVQVLASVAVVAALLADVDLRVLGRALRQTSPGLLGLALGSKAIALVLRELRLWLALPRPRPGLPAVLGVGFTAGALNLVLPGRGGDIAAIAMLNRELRVPADKATSAVAVTSFLEAAVFGMLLLGVLLVGASRWRLVVGPAAHAQAVGALTLITLGGVAVAVALVILARLLARRAPPSPRDAPVPQDAPRPPGQRALRFLRAAITSTGDDLSDWRLVAANSFFALLQVLGVVGAMTLALPAVGIHIPLPWLAASGVLAIASLAAIVLPSSYGAGPAAASVAVLTVFGATQADALAYAVLGWFIAHVPPVLFGVPAIWTRRLKD